MSLTQGHPWDDEAPKADAPRVGFFVACEPSYKEIPPISGGIPAIHGGWHP